MTRQNRSDTTRQALLDAAVAAFDDVGYGECTVGDIVTRVGLTKGAFYHHFPSKEGVAAAIVSDANTKVMEAVRLDPRLRIGALEGMIHGCLDAADVIAADTSVRTGLRLSRITGGHVGAAMTALDAWLSRVDDGFRRAVAEGDARRDLQTRSAAEVVCSLMISAEVLAESRIGRSIREIVVDAWSLLLPSIVDDECVTFWTSFLRGRAM